MNKTELITLIRRRLNIAMDYSNTIAGKVAADTLSDILCYVEKLDDEYKEWHECLDDNCPYCTRIKDNTGARPHERRDRHYTDELDLG